MSTKPTPLFLADICTEGYKIGELPDTTFLFRESGKSMMRLNIMRQLQLRGAVPMLLDAQCCPAPKITDGRCENCQTVIIDTVSPSMQKAP